MSRCISRNGREDLGRCGNPVYSTGGSYTGKSTHTALWDAGRYNELKITQSRLVEKVKLKLRCTAEKCETDALYIGS